MPGIVFSKIISGGQTGADRAALDVALDWKLKEEIDAYWD